MWVVVVEDGKGEELAPEGLEFKGERGYEKHNLVHGREVGTR